MINYEIVTRSSVLAIPLGMLKLHGRTDGAEEDSLITDYIHDATAFCEGQTNRAFLTQSWQAVMLGFPSERIRFARPKLQSVENLVYIDTDGTEQILDSSLYTVDTDSFIGTIRPAFNTIWPQVQEGSNVVISYTCGYGDEPSDLPHQARAAIRYMATHYYEERQPIGKSTSPIPLTVESLLIQIAVPEVK